MNEKEAAEHNAIAWLSLSDRELIERSASLGFDADLHPELGEASGRLAKKAELLQMREAADKVAKGHAGAAFVKKWIAEYRGEGDDDVVSF
jgi:hypothetical protein